MKIPRFIFIPALFFASCSSDPFPGFTEDSTDHFFKLEKFSDSERKAKEGDLMVIAYRAYDELGNRISDDEHPSGRDTFLQSKTLGPFFGVLAHFAEGDSGTVLLVNPENKKQYQKIELQVLKIRSQAEMEAERKRLAEVGDMEENKAMKEYIKYMEDVGFKFEKVDNGLYILPMLVGKGDSVKGGKKVQVTYTGYFLDGRKFDGTKKGEALEFVYGTEMQVIAGLEKAIGRMREGDKSKIIIPSHLAYGEKGSSTGVVPPFTTLIYEVEIIKVK